MTSKTTFANLDIADLKKNTPKSTNKFYDFMDPLGLL